MSAARPRLGVVVPALEEQERIAGTVGSLRASLGADLEVVVVDDGSRDGTADAAEAAGATVVRHPRNRGKGAAIRSGFAATTAAVVAYTDADLAYPPEQIADMAARVGDGADVVIGNRRDPASTTLVAASALRDLGGRAINGITRLALAGGWADTQGGLKCFDGEVGRALLAATHVDGFAIDVEVLAIAERWGLEVAEVPVVVSHSASSTVRVVADAARLALDVLAVRRRRTTGAYDPPPDVVGRGSPGAGSGRR